MQKKTLTILLLLIAATLVCSQEPYLKITANVEPKNIKQGEEGTLKIKITPRNDVKISSHPEFMIRLEKNINFSFPKLFFTASELDYPTKPEKDIVFLELDKEVSLTFKVNKESLLGRQFIRGEVVFTAVWKKDNWSLKTYQKFNVNFTSQRNRKIRQKRR